MAGYSKTPLAKKLGIKENSKILILNQPDHYLKTLGSIPKGVEIKHKLGEKFKFIQFFANKKQGLENMFPTLKKSLPFDGMLWISWPKNPPAHSGLSSGSKTGGPKAKTDLDENIVMEIGLKNGLVDVKVCAIDETWSGLKFVFRIKDRESI